MSLDTDVPTLVLAGQFDPNAIPAVSCRVADLIGRHAQWVAFAHAGHSVRAYNPRARRIVANFVTELAPLPDTSCADRLEPISFLPRW